MDIGSVGQWAAATATLLAVLVALFKDEALRWWRRPKLFVSCSALPPDCAKTQLHYTIQRTALTYAVADCYYFRLWVENRGLARAVQVQVYAARLLRRAADGSFRAVEKFLPMNLRWSHGRPPPHGPEIFADGISPQMGKHCDLGHITNPSNRRELGEDLPDIFADKTLFALELEISPATLSHLLPPGTYQLEIKVAAANCSPILKAIELTVTGDWFDEDTRMFRDGCGLRIIK